MKNKIELIIIKDFFGGDEEYAYYIELYKVNGELFLKEDMSFLTYDEAYNYITSELSYQYDIYSYDYKDLTN